MFIENFSKLIKLALPISAYGLINMVASFTAMIFVSKLGEQHLAAGALGVSTFMTIMTLIMTTFYAVGILIGHTKGNEKKSYVGTIVVNGFWLALFLIFPAFIILWNCPKILLFLGQDPSIVQLTQPYFAFSALSMIPTLLNVVINQFFIGIGRPGFSLIMSLMSTPLIILLSYGFILGDFALPQLGLGGIPCSIFIVSTFSFIFQFCYIKFSNDLKDYKIFSIQFKPDFGLCKKILFLGFPIGIQFGGELAAMAVATYFIGFFGVNALASSQISSQCSLIIIMISLGLSQALSVLVSEAYSKKNTLLIKSYINASLIILILFFSFVFIVFNVLSKDLINIYIDVNNIENKDTVFLAAVFLQIAAATLLVDGFRNLFSAALRGLQDSKTPMKIGIACLWFVSLPFCYATAFWFQTGPIGLRVGFLSGFILASLILIFYLKNKLDRVDVCHSREGGNPPSKISIFR